MSALPSCRRVALSEPPLYSMKAFKPDNLTEVGRSVDISLPSAASGVEEHADLCVTMASVFLVRHPQRIIVRASCDHRWLSLISSLIRLSEFDYRITWSGFVFHVFWARVTLAADKHSHASTIVTCQGGSEHATRGDSNASQFLPDFRKCKRDSFLVVSAS